MCKFYDKIQWARISGPVLKKTKQQKTTLVLYLRKVNEHVFIGFSLIEKTVM